MEIFQITGHRHFKHILIYEIYIMNFAKIKKGNNICIEKIEKEGALIEALVKCIRSLVQIVERKQKFLSNQMVPDLYTAGIVTRIIDQKDFSKR